MQRRTIEKIAGLARDAEEARRCIMVLDQSTQQTLRRLAANGKLTRVAPNVYARTDYWEGLPDYEKALHHMRSLQAAHPNWVFCTTSAALIHGLSVPLDRQGEIHVIAPIGSASSTSRGVTRHLHAECRTARVEGLLTTPIEDTVIDCLRTTGFDRGLAIADSALRVTDMDRRDLIDAVERLAYAKRGARQARMTASWADGRSENGGESVARANMIRLGFMVPELQVSICDPMQPSREYRADYVFSLPDGSLVVGELDGRAKYEADPHGPEAARYRERRRESRITAQGFKVMRFSLGEATDAAYFERLLTTFGIPRECPHRYVDLPHAEPSPPSRYRRNANAAVPTSSKTTKSGL